MNFLVGASRFLRCWTSIIPTLPGLKYGVLIDEWPLPHAGEKWSDQTDLRAARTILCSPQNRRTNTLVESGWFVLLVPGRADTIIGLAGSNSPLDWFSCLLSILMTFSSSHQCGKSMLHSTRKSSVTSRTQLPLSVRHGILGVVLVRFT